MNCIGNGSFPDERERPLSLAVTFLAIFSLGSIDAITGIVLGIFVFVFSLFTTRFFDAQLTQATKKSHQEIMAIS